MSDTSWKILKIVGIVLAIALYIALSIKPDRYNTDAFDKLYDALNDMGYDYLEDYVHDNFTVDEIYSKKEIMNEVIGNGWIVDYVQEHPEDFSYLYE